MRKENDIKKWINNKLEMDCNIVAVRKSGEVLVIRVQNKEDKKVIMSNKLKGDKVKIKKEIENDLISWEERKLQKK